MNDCPFCCKITNGGDEHGRILDYLPGDVFRFEPVNPVTPGHVLFVPRMHIRDARDFPEMAGRCFTAASAYGMVMAEDFNLITSAGMAATQTVPHLHIHYVPRHNGDGLALPWTAS